MTQTESIKALTIHQPWAWAIIRGIKRVENRRWKTSYRGPLVIHAGKSTRSLQDWPNDIPRPRHDELIFGYLLGTVELVDCVAISDIDDPFAIGPWCWLLKSPQPFDHPIPYRGQPALFDLQMKYPQIVQVAVE